MSRLLVCDDNVEFDVATTAENLYTCMYMCVCVRMIKPNDTKFKTEQFLKHGQNLAGPSSRGANEERNKHASPNSQLCQAQAVAAAADAAAAAATAAEKLTKRERGERPALRKESK